MLWKKIRWWRSSKPTEATATGLAHEEAAPRGSRYLNQELSDLAFIDRVLQESANPAHPALERLRFVSLSAANLDQFYTVRVANLHRKIDAGDSSSGVDGLSPQQQLRAVNAKADRLLADQQLAWIQIRDELLGHNIRLISPGDLSTAELTDVQQHFERNVLPVLSPFIIDREHPFPYIPSGGLCVVAEGKRNLGQQTHLLIPIPSSLPRFIALPGEGFAFVTIEALIIHFIDAFFSNAQVQTCGTFQILRDNELALEERFDDLMQMVETGLKKRETANVIRLKISEEMSEHARIFIAESLGVLSKTEIEHLKEQDLPIATSEYILIDSLLGLGGMQTLIDTSLAQEYPALVFTPHTPSVPERISLADGTLFDVTSDHDLLLHWPYDDFGILVNFIQQAAVDAKVTAIKQTLYRTNDDSPIVAALIDAAERGKAVTAVIELEARDDESANVRFAKRMEAAGVQIVYGIVGLKVHCKMTLVVRREGDDSVIYTHLGTGNYHPRNARSYTDLALFTNDPALGRDVNNVFNYLTSGNLMACQQLTVSPGSLRPNIMALIDREIENSQAGRAAEIWVKLNSLTDPEIIDKLYEASNKGVKIDLTVRRHCCLRPGVAGLSENITVRSIVGRFLEHSRIYCFANGHALPHPKALVFLSSADWMKRNLDERVEVMVPILDAIIHRQILDEVMVANTRDTMQSWILSVDGTYERSPDGDFSAQQWLIENPGISGRCQ